MKSYPHPIIAREGWPFLAISIILAIAAAFWCAPWYIPLWFIALFALQFICDPAGEILQVVGAMLSPADGRIVAAERVNYPYAKREAIKVSVFMNVFNVHSNRSPVDGSVQQVWYFPGKFINTDQDKASTENERKAVWLKTASGTDITSVQVAGLIARRILCYVKAGAVLTRRQRYGFIRFGSRVDVYLPLDANVKVSIGDHDYLGNVGLKGLV